MTRTLETVTFRLAEKTDRQGFLDAAEAVSAWVRTQPGFEYRVLVEDEAGTWTDHVFWSSLEAAKSAAKAIMAADVAKPFMAMIDPNSAAMTHRPMALTAAG